MLVALLFDRPFGGPAVALVLAVEAAAFAFERALALCKRFVLLTLPFGECC
jgi:hypothetical protein